MSNMDVCQDIRDSIDYSVKITKEIAAANKGRPSLRVTISVSLKALILNLKHF